MSDKVNDGGPTSPSDRSVVDELRDLLVDWNGEQISDSSLPRLEVYCGTLRRAADLIEAQAREVAGATKLADRYGVALMMIRAGCSNPRRFAGNILDDVKPIDIDLEDLT